MLSAESNGKRIHLVGEAKCIVEQFRRLYVGQYMVLEEEETDESDRESTRELVFNESNMPIYASYGVNRYVSDRRNKVLKKDIKLAGKLEALRDVFDPTINFQLFFEWFRGRQEYENSKRVEKESFKDAQLSAVREAILKIMNNDFSDIKIKIDDEVTIDDKLLENTDIKKISKVKVKGNIYPEGNNFSVNLNIKCILTLVCSISLKDVEYNIDINVNEIIGENDDILEENNKIINNSIDLIPIIWQNIILEVPLKVVSPDIEVKNINGDGWRFITDEEVVEKEIDPRLEKLKEFLGE